MQVRDLWIGVHRRFRQWRQPWSLLARGHLGDWRVTKSKPAGRTEATLDTKGRAPAR